MKSKIVLAATLSLVMGGIAYAAASKPTFDYWNPAKVWTSVDTMFERHDEVRKLPSSTTSGFSPGPILTHWAQDIGMMAPTSRQQVGRRRPR
jgi:hypothetical protein